MDRSVLLEKLRERGESVIFLGDGTQGHEEAIREQMGMLCQFAPAHLNRQRAAAVAAMGTAYFAAGKIETAMEHVPNYLRKAQAERELEEAKRQGKMQELAAGHSVGTGEDKQNVSEGSR